MADERRLQRQRDARAVARLAVGGECPAMAEVREARQCQVQHTVSRVPPGVRDETDATRIVLEAWVVQRVGGIGETSCHGSLHRAIRLQPIQPPTGRGSVFLRSRWQRRGARRLTVHPVRRDHRVMKAGVEMATVDPGDNAQRLEELTFLATVAHVAASTRTWDELMATIIDQARAAARADVCSLYLMDRDGSGLTLAATNGLDREQIGVARLGLGQGLTGLAARDRAPVTSDDVHFDPRFAWIRGVDQARFTSMCSVPLMWNEQVVGVVNVQTVERRLFSPADI